MLFLDITYRIVLFGHRDFNEHRKISERLYLLLENLIRTNSFVEIYIGRNGEFDIYAASIIKQIQKAVGKSNNEFICVLPYSVKDIEYYNEYYDNVIIPEFIGKMHYKRAITERNKWMVAQADLFICYVEKEEGGAYAALKYAKKLKKKIINLAEEEFE